MPDRDTQALAIADPIAGSTIDNTFGNLLADLLRYLGGSIRRFFFPPSAPAEPTDIEVGRAALLIDERMRSLISEAQGNLNSEAVDRRIETATAPLIERIQALEGDRAKVVRVEDCRDVVRHLLSFDCSRFTDSDLSPR